MRSFVLLLISLSVYFNSLAQPYNKSMSDGHKRIYYSDMEDAKKKLQSYYEERRKNNISDAGIFPYNMFKDLILHDERSFSFDFSFEQVKEIYSDDRTIKIYAWQADGGGAIRHWNYGGVFSYKHNGYYYCISPDDYDDYDGIDRDAYHNIIPLWLDLGEFKACGYSDGDHYFLLGFTYKTYGYIDNLYGYKINKEGVVQKSNIFISNGKSNNVLESEVLPLWNDYSNFIYFKNDNLYVPIMYQPEETKEYCFPYPSGRVSVWEKKEHSYIRSGYKFDDNEKIFCELRNYRANIVTLDLSPWKIRIELMPNGSYRYSSWKNADISATPVMVVNNGYRQSPIEGDKGFKSFKEEFIFHNGQYFYIVAYEMVILNGRYDMQSSSLTVKKNEKVLMQLKSNAN